MKIGMMTTHASLNCGAVLQAYASQTFLTNLGHNVEFIDYREPSKKVLRDYISKSIIKTWHNWEDLYFGYIFRKSDEFGEALKKGPIRYLSLEELQTNPPNYDVYIAGSDQIWTVGGRKKVRRPYYLDFGSKSTKRISYAASLGQGLVPEYMEPEMKELLLNFDSLSVRESSGVAYVQNLVGDKKKVHHVIDPTLLLKASDYETLITSKELESKEKFIVCYSLAAYEKEQHLMIDYIQKKFALPIKNLRNPDSCIRLKNAKNIIVKPNQWLAYIKSAEFIICTSFHAVVFSLIFHKPFVLVSPYYNKRVMSLLKLVNLEERFTKVFDEKKLDEMIAKQIDWNHVDEMIASNRKDSIAFLTNALNN